jgi:hypothetical protein
MGQRILFTSFCTSSIRNIGHTGKRYIQTGQHSLDFPAGDPTGTSIDLEENFPGPTFNPSVVLPELSLKLPFLSFLSSFRASVAQEQWK